MKRIGGLVLVRETGVGVPNLVVAVFDSDVTIADIRGQDMSAKIAQRLGKRISSVLTDASGRFSITAEDLEFAGNESRPDLMLMVMAPEDVLDVRRPYPAPTEERILYLSTVPRLDAGAEEAYVIRLLQAQLDKFRIATAQMASAPHVAATEVTDAVLRALDVRDGIRKNLAPRLNAERRAHKQARTIAKAKVQLDALPPHLKSNAAQHSALIIRGHAQLATDLPKLQAKAIAEGLARLKKPDNRPKLRLRLSDQEIKRLKLTVKRGRISGTIKGSDLTDRVRAHVNVLDMVRHREPDWSLDDLQRKYLDEPPPVASKKPSRQSKKPRRKP